MDSYIYADCTVAVKNLQTSGAFADALWESGPRISPTKSTKFCFKFKMEEKGECATEKKIFCFTAISFCHFYNFIFKVPK